MYYYEVLVGDVQYHGNEALTYSSEQRIPIRSLVKIALRNRQVLGVVVKEVSKPSFTTKPISNYDAQFNPLPEHFLDVVDWLKDYYPAPLGSVVRQFLPPDTTTPKNMPIKTLETREIEEQPNLTSEQKKVLDLVKPSGMHVIHGVTGSGKTRIYLELASNSLKNKRSALILTPEIGLTAQLVIDFERQFPGRVIVFHSQLTTATRRNLWYQILNSTEPLVVIGPRSALFTPVQNIGLIVIDEAHESAYKNESAPHYLTSRVAGKLATLHHAQLIIGSATPLVDDYFIARTKNLPILNMQVSATSVVAGESTIEVVDMKDRSQFSKSQLLSDPLLLHISQALDKKEQVLLFLNRRGTAKVILCNVCGWQMHCPRCDLPLTYHGDEHLVRCHVCGFHDAFPGDCPTCGNADIILKSIGTKALTTEVTRLFPSARVQRFDSDSSKQERLEHHIVALKAGDVDIVVGTQTVAKGLDLPKLSVVGVVQADTSLYIPDYTAAERTYQLLTQVIGRVGRGHRAGYAVIQTYSPDSPTLQSVVKKDWSKFLTSELEERETYKFPPYFYLLKLGCSRSSSQSAERASMNLVDTLRGLHKQIIIEGPAPAFHTKEGNKYRWQIIIKAKQRTQLTDIIRDLPSGWSYDIDPINLL